MHFAQTRMGVFPEKAGIYAENRQFQAVFCLKRAVAQAWLIYQIACLSGID